MTFLEQVALRHPLFFFRHGETDWNRDRRFQGLTDIPLNATGEEQARAYGRVLRPLVESADGYHLVSSPLSRATRTLEVILEELGHTAPYLTDERLVEVDYGAWNGMDHDRIREEWPDDWAAMQEDKWTYRRPEGESYEDRLEPVMAFLKELADLDTPAIIVGHGGSGRVLRAIIAGHPPAQVVHLPMTQDQFYAFDGGCETVHRCCED